MKTVSPLISIVIATYNSEKIITKVLGSIKKQRYPSKKIEILIIDGGSTDSTLNLVRKYGCKIFNNSKVDFVNGKFIGYKKARGKYLMLLDSDEVLVNKNSLRNKVESMNLNNKVKVVLSSGYENPENYPSINFYVNDYGDPFSFFMYRCPRRNLYFLNELKKRYKVFLENKKTDFFDFSKLENPPFIEMISMGVMIDLEYIKKTFPKIFKESSVHTHIFYLLNSKNNWTAIEKNDPIIHYSVPTFKKYLKKISSRVKNNIFETKMGRSGFVGREKFYTKSYKLKKMLFIPYSFSIVLPILDSIYLVFNRKEVIYLMHFLLCLYTSILIIYFFILKKVGGKTNLVGYGK